MSLILIVDDHEENLYLLQTLLQGYGYRVVTATNGAEALKVAYESPPDLIVSDILMPMMDGFSLCRHWKADDRLKSIPFVFYTATYTDPKDEEFALSLGAERFIIKPAEPEDFLRAIRGGLEAHEAGKLVASREPVAEENVYYKLYNETLVRKLEEKTAELEQANATLEQRVAVRTAQLRALAAELTRSEDRQRRRLAHTLHDSLQQILVAAKLKAKTLGCRLRDQSGHLLLNEITALLDQAVDQSRSLALELSPPILQDAGLSAGLMWLARHFQETYGLAVQLDVNPEADPASEDLKLLLFQTVRELLLNVAKHAHTDTAQVTMVRHREDRVQLVVEDNGLGFDPSVLDNHDASHGFGLFNIRERLEWIGGCLEVVTAPGQGTRVTIEVPLRE